MNQDSSILIHITIAQHQHSEQAVERLAELFGQHAIVTEQLRELHPVEANSPADRLARVKWHSLESQVAHLRSEIENFKQVFAHVADSAFTDERDSLFA